MLLGDSQPGSNISRPKNEGRSKVIPFCLSLYRTIVLNLNLLHIDIQMYDQKYFISSPG